MHSYLKKMHELLANYSYMHSYLKKMHELLANYSERTRTDTVYHTPSVIELQWETQRYQNNELRGHGHGQYYQGQEYQYQIVVPIQDDQISPSTYQRCGYSCRSGYTVWAPYHQQSVYHHRNYDLLQMSRVLQNHIRDHGYNLCHIRRSC